MHIFMEKLSSKGTHSLYTFIKSVAKNDKVEVEKVKNKFKNYIQTTCTSAEPGENISSFKKISIKLYDELQSQATHCLYIWGQKMTKDK